MKPKLFEFSCKQQQKNTVNNQKNPHKTASSRDDEAKEGSMRRLSGA